MTHIANNGPKNCAIISFMPHNVCNYTCDYCHVSSNGGDLRWNKSFQSVANFVNTIRARNEYAYLQIIGGEPHLPEFIEAIKHENLIIEMNSNGSRSLRYWEEFTPGKNIINFSWHSKEANIHHLINVVDIMKGKAYVFVTLLATPDNFSQMKTVLNLFSNKGLQIEICPTRLSIVRSEQYPFDEEQRLFMKNYKQDWAKIYIPDWKQKLHPDLLMLNEVPIKWKNIISSGINTFTGWECSAGINRFTIDPLGDIRRCHQSVGGILGNVYSTYTLPEKFINCTYPHPCHCKLDAMVEKYTTPIKEN
jgi:sulfatase maturation enzyme AslB (radical SAM superfamily)